MSHRHLRQLLELERSRCQYSWMRLCVLDFSTPILLLPGFSLDLFIPTSFAMPDQGTQTSPAGQRISRDTFNFRVTIQLPSRSFQFLPEELILQNLHLPRSRTQRANLRYCRIRQFGINLFGIASAPPHRRTTRVSDFGHHRREVCRDLGGADDGGRTALHVPGSRSHRKRLQHHAIHANYSKSTGSGPACPSVATSS
ncbi:uncharacterized protein M421DRAFT_164594 [Didymella exigua CBS 183.55]|uniref:Uncharacterized protein n=1 Tax=Didymella exigua CBS 183.55 TaxID=1150837 RepID=A0A6A5RNM9_9PLEO|nr:uncharacterized protein M421DRAFT_164594 [Didymella exigua CBS 183.55]KAF1927946.1 hypothetical protein M421DRAFT_164594 [Didymella exigua CBS 183.55]